MVARWETDSLGAGQEEQTSTKVSEERSLSSRISEDLQGTLRYFFNILSRKRENKEIMIGLPKLFDCFKFN